MLCTMQTMADVDDRQPALILLHDALRNPLSSHKNKFDRRLTIKCIVGCAGSDWALSLTALNDPAAVGGSALNGPAAVGGSALNGPAAVGGSALRRHGHQHIDRPRQMGIVYTYD